jgi:hypothetical protein
MRPKNSPTTGSTIEGSPKLLIRGTTTMSAAIQSKAAATATVRLHGEQNLSSRFTFGHIGPNGAPDVPHPIPVTGDRYGDS